MGAFSIKLGKGKSLGTSEREVIVGRASVNLSGYALGHSVLKFFTAIRSKYLCFP